jgi:hypothetical protein
MFRYLILALLVLLGAALWATPDFYPQTLIGESFNSTFCPGYIDAIDGLGALDGMFHPGEFFSFQYYMDSGPLSNSFSDARAAYYGISLYPTVMFNGTQPVLGVGDEIADGSLYLAALQSKLFSPSPVKVSISDFIPSQSRVTGTITMISETYSLTDQHVRYVLVESSVGTDGINVVREVVTQSLTLSGQNNTINFDVVFTTSTAGNPANFWPAVFVQLDNQTIIQADAYLAGPQFQVRAAYDFSPHIIGDANVDYSSEPIWIFNTGETENFTLRLLKDDGPEDWYFNYCSEDGNCYPGFLYNPFTLEAGQYAGYHLNLIIGSSGIANFHFEVDSDNIEPYNIPFVYQTSDTSADDYTLPAVTVGLLQNYPNPFSGNTTLKLYSKQNTGSAVIEIYNVRGQKVSSITTPELKTGTTLLTWDGSGTDGKPLPQGVYYSRLKGTETASVRKMLIMHK